MAIWLYQKGSWDIICNSIRNDKNKYLFVHSANTVHYTGTVLFYLLKYEKHEVFYVQLPHIHFIIYLNLFKINRKYIYGISLRFKVKKV